MILGALGALAQPDIRRFLGFVVVSGIGYMLAGIAIGGESGVSAAIFYALHSIVLMTALYLVAGIAARLGRGFSLNGLAGLYAQVPAFAFLSLALFFAGSGLPPFSGFWPKALLVKAALDIGAWWLAAAILVAGFVTTIAFGRVFLLAYWRPAPPQRKAPPSPRPSRSQKSCRGGADGADRLVRSVPGAIGGAQPAGRGNADRAEQLPEVGLP